MNELCCLVVDDDAAKSERVRRAIELEVGSGRVQVDLAVSANEAVARLKVCDYDLLIVDLNLPLRSGETAVSDGGTKLLRQVARGTGNIRRPLSIMGVTAYAEFATIALDEFRKHGWALLTYSPESNEWEEAIINQCLHLTAYKARMRTAGTSDRADVCIITALSDIELEAVFDVFVGLTTFALPGDEARYAEGLIDVGGRAIRVVACAAPEMGNSAAAMISTKVISKFRPHVSFMAGVCAGIDANIGDIAVAEHALHYESGKWTEGTGGEAVFLPQPRYLGGGNAIIGAIQRYKLDHSEEIMSLPAKWRGEQTSTPPKVIIGPIASGASVVENRTIVDNLKFRDRKLVALEMESYGFYIAGRNCGLPKTEFVMVKGVCDSATPPKTDKFQKYAAFLSAQFIHNFILAEAHVLGGLFAP